MPTAHNDQPRNDLPPLRVESLVNGGAGLARHEGRIIFIPHVAPGDLVRCGITKSKKNYAEAETVEILESSPHRRRPDCPAFGLCGGCQWQHLAYADQLNWKEKLFRETLTRTCAVDPAMVLPLIAATAEWNYRSRIQIKCHGPRGHFITGFYRRKSRYVIGINQCSIAASELNDLLTQLGALLGRFHDCDRIPQIDLAVDDVGKRGVTVHYLGTDAVTLETQLVDAGLDADLLLQAGSRDRRKLIQGNGILEIRPYNGIRLEYGMGGFAQINLAQNRVLVERVVQLAALTGTEQVVDLFCGMGNFSLPLAMQCRTLTGVEESSLSVRHARRNAKLNNITHCEFIAASAIDGFEKISAGQTIDLLVLDPPRTGAYDLVRALIRHPVKKILYVSCDPQTLARDLLPLLHNGYSMVLSQPLDLFPQTHHCESVTLLHYADD